MNFTGLLQPPRNGVSRYLPSSRRLGPGMTQTGESANQPHHWRAAVGAGAELGTRLAAVVFLAFAHLLEVAAKAELGGRDQGLDLAGAFLELAELVLERGEAKLRRQVFFGVLRVLRGGAGIAFRMAAIRTHLRQRLDQPGRQCVAADRQQRVDEEGDNHRDADELQVDAVIAGDAGTDTAHLAVPGIAAEAAQDPEVAATETVLTPIRGGRAVTVPG